jgi:hypothetical protein
METLEYTQAGKPKKQGGAGRRSRLEIDPNLARKIIYRLAEGYSMQQTADDLEINIRTLRMWARVGDQQESGPLHDIAVAINRSKATRGFGDKHPQANGAPTPSDRGQATTSATPHEEPASDGLPPQEPAATEAKHWSSDCLHPWDASELSTEQLKPACLRMAMAGSADVERKDEPINPPGITSETDEQADDMPAPGHFRVLTAGLGPGWEKFTLSAKEFEAMYALCDSARHSPSQFIPTERRWPRDLKALTSEQFVMINAGARVLVCDSEGNYFQVDFKRSQY